jgi:hypothetical protein
MATQNTLFAITPTTSPEALALIQTLVGSGALRTVAAPSAPTTPVTPLTRAETAIASIPVAEDGDVIHADYHNSLRTALASLLEEVGVGRGPVAPQAPALIAINNEPWTLALGAAKFTGPTTGIKNAFGYLPVDLPHGGEIQSLIATGRRQGALELEVILRRQELTGDAIPKTGTIAALAVPNVDGPFSIPKQAGAASITNPTPEQVADFRRVDNTRFKYFVSAEVNAGQVGSSAQLNAIQVVVQRV